jgi:hypothetical protein
MQTAPCSFSKSRVIITVKVPAITLQENPKFYSIRVLPFSHEGKVCHLNVENMNIISNSNTVVRAHLETCSSSTNELCKYRKFPDAYFPNNDCLKTIVVNNSPIGESIGKCGFVCTKQEMHSTHLMQLDESTFIIMFLPPTITLFCKGKIVESVSHTKINSTQHVSIPCGCKLIAEGLEVSPSYSCQTSLPQKLLLHHLFPGAWITSASPILTNQTNQTLIWRASSTNIGQPTCLI